VDADAPTAPPPSEPAQGHRRRRRAKGGGLKLGDNLSSMQSTLEAKKRELKAQAQEEPKTYEINPEIEIDFTHFCQELEECARQQEAANRINLASILRNGESELYHNRWTFNVQDDLQKNIVEREGDILPYLRKKLNVPELFVEFKVTPDEDQKQENIPYTDDQKLREMGKTNPVLSKLQEIFKTRIIY